MGSVHAQGLRWGQTPMVHISTVADLVSVEAQWGLVVLGFPLVHVRITASDSAGTVTQWQLSLYLSFEI